jgi:putative tricarboxylic transport membrane protein
MGKNEYIGAGFFIALGVFTWAVSFQFPVLPGGHPGPSLFPRVLGTLFIFFSLIVILQSRSKSKTPPAPPAEVDEGGNVTLIGKENYFNAVLVIILIAAFIAFTKHLGFIITGGAVLFILMLKLQVRPLAGLIISAVVVSFIYTVFAKGLRVPLPHGFLWW